MRAGRFIIGVIAMALAAASVSPTAWAEEAASDTEAASQATVDEVAADSGRSPEVVARNLRSQAAVDAHASAVQVLLNDPANGGLFIAEDGTLTIPFTDPVSQLNDATLDAYNTLSAATETAMPLVIDPLWELEDARQELWDSMQVLLRGRGVEIPWTTIDEAENALVIGVLGDVDAAQEAVATVVQDVRMKFVPMARTIAIGALPHVVGREVEDLTGPLDDVDACIDRQHCSPLRSGLEIAIDDTYLCSSAFLATHTNGPGLMTAGHCGSNGNDVWHLSKIGKMYGRYMKNHVWGYVDAAMVDIESPLTTGSRPWIYRSEENKDWAVTSAGSSWVNSKGVRKETPLVGALICKAGYKTHQTCGEVLNYVDLAQGSIEGSSVAAKNVPCADLVTDHGDSGAGIFAAHQAVGIFWGGLNASGTGVCGNNEDAAVFTPSRRAEKALLSTISTL